MTLMTPKNTDGGGDGGCRLAAIYWLHQYVDINIASSAENVYSVIIIIDSPFESTIDLQKAYPGIGKKAKVVSCGVQGVCGYIMNDFGDHVIEDADGEEVKVITND